MARNRYQTAALAELLDSLGIAMPDEEGGRIADDTLALFIWRELADHDDEPMDRATAAQRLRSAIGDLQGALAAVEELGE